MNRREKPNESYTKRLYRTLFNSRIRLASQRTIELQERIEELEQNMAEMSLLCMSLMNVLTDSGLIDVAELDEVMAELDQNGEGVPDVKSASERLRAQIQRDGFSGARSSNSTRPLPSPRAPHRSEQNSRTRPVPRPIGQERASHEKPSPRRENTRPIRALGRRDPKKSRRSETRSPRNFDRRQYDR